MKKIGGLYILLILSLFVNIFFLSFFILKPSPVAKKQEAQESESTKKAKDNPSSNNIFSFKNRFGVESYISAIDINNDGIEEIIYQPRSWSWHNTTFILKEDEELNLVSFCSNCTFASHSSMPEFKDLNGDKLIDVVLPRVFDGNETEENVRYDFIGDNYIKR